VCGTSNPRIVRLAVFLSCLVFLFGLHRLNRVLGFDAPTAVLVSLIYAAGTFAIWAISRRFIGRYGGIGFFGITYVAFVQVKNPDTIVEDLSVAFFAEFVMVLLTMIFAGVMPRNVHLEEDDAPREGQLEIGNPASPGSQG
jgi:hypothetical protein